MKYGERLAVITTDSILNVSSQFLNTDFTTVIVGDSSAILAAPVWNEKSVKGLKLVVILESDLIK